MPGLRQLDSAQNPLRQLALPLLVACATMLAGCTTPGATVSGPFNVVPAPDTSPAYTAQQRRRRTTW